MKCWNRCHCKGAKLPGKIREPLSPHDIGDKLGKGNLLRSIFSIICFAHNMLPTLQAAFQKVICWWWTMSHTSVACLKHWAPVCRWCDKTGRSLVRIQLWNIRHLRASSLWQFWTTAKGSQESLHQYVFPLNFLLNILIIHFAVVGANGLNMQRVILGNSPKCTLHYLQVWEISISDIL